MKDTLIKAVGLSPVVSAEFFYPPLDLNVKSATMTSLIGPGSYGKTSWLKTLNGLNVMDRGELSLLQYDVRRLTRKDWLNLRKDVSYVGQDTALLSAYTLLENILLPALYHKQASRDELTGQAYRLLEEIGFKDLDALNRLPAFTTDLQNYYVKLVRGLIVKPRLLFLDDLYAHISLEEVSSLHRFIQQKIVDTGLSVVLTTARVKQVVDESSSIVFVSPEKVRVYEGRQALLESGDQLIEKYLFKNDVH